MKQMKILGINGSLRKNSTNLGLLRYAEQNAPVGTVVKIADLSQIPFYNSDITEKPPAVKALLADFEQADALLMACPEYNYSLAPALKNALDWVSREPDNHLLAGKPSAILGSGGGMGTSRAQYQLRQVCVFLNLHLLNKPEIFCNAFTGNFDEEGNLISNTIQELIVEQLTELQKWAHLLRS